VVGLLALVLLLGMAERQKGELEAKNAELERANAALAAANVRERASADLARQTIEDMTSEEALRFLETQKALRPEQKQFLERAVAYYRQFVASAAAEERDRVRQGKAYFGMGYLLARLNLTDDARTAFTQAIGLGEKLAADFPAVPEYRLALARSHTSLGNVLRDRGERGAPRQAYGQALTLQEELAADSPAADSLEPVPYDWTEAGYEVRQALKRYSDETHADP
jgi:tetratricopeptide (TPR) repeat protein